MLRGLMACLLLASCTMPLPTLENQQGGESIPLPSPPPIKQGAVPQAFITQQDAHYNNEKLQYLDLNPCGSPDCAYSFEAPVSISLRYEFVYANRSPVEGQLPVFSTPREGESDSPFRRVFEVIVPENYQVNTLRSSQDILASQLRIEATQKVLNHPLVLPNKKNTLPLNTAEGWMAGEKVSYSQLGRVPYSASRNQLGVGFVYFLRNNDRSNLPFQPLPIFDSQPGDFLYSPVRQVFRAVSNTQIAGVQSDPSRFIRSQDDLLKAVNAGVFSLEDTQTYFNFPVYDDRSTLPPDENILELSWELFENFPTLPDTAHYALWAIDNIDNRRLISRFKPGQEILLDLNEQPLINPIFRFSERELTNMKRFEITLEATESNSASRSVFLEATYQKRSDNKTDFKCSFCPEQEKLLPGNFILSAPTDLQESHLRSGIWFARNNSGGISFPPQPSRLSPGFFLPTLPRGWFYQGWVLVARRPDTWLRMGRFQKVNASDLEAPHSGENPPYDFPGEDFILNPPPGVQFPINLPESGDREVWLAMEPEGIAFTSPFYALHRGVIAGGTPPFKTQVIQPTSLKNPRFVLSFSEL